MLDEAELIQVRDDVIRLLSELLRSEPEIATTIEGILAEHFPRRDEFARLLDELTQHRAETSAGLGDSNTSSLQASPSHLTQPNA